MNIYKEKIGWTRKMIEIRIERERERERTIWRDRLGNDVKIIKWESKFIKKFIDEWSKLLYIWCFYKIFLWVLVYRKKNVKISFHNISHNTSIYCQVIYWFIWPYSPYEICLCMVNLIIQNGFKIISPSLQAIQFTIYYISHLSNV